MRLHPTGDKSIGALPLDELLKIASEGPRSLEERLRERLMQDCQADVAHLDARCNALAELARRMHPAPTVCHGAHGAHEPGVTIPLDGRGPAHAVHRPDIAGEELMRLDECAGLLRDASALLLKVASALAMHGDLARSAA